MLKKRCGAALLSLSLCLGLCCPAYAGEAEPSPKTEAQTEGPDNPAGYYALDPARPGAALLAAPRVGNIVDSGFCGAEGNNLEWTLDSEGTLTISGTGKMEDYSIGSAPWNRRRGDVLQAVIQEGVTSIGDSAFYSCDRLASAAISDGVSSIGDCAFLDCHGLTGVTIPGSVTFIGGNPFSSCRRLTQVTAGSGNPAFISVDGVLFNKTKTSLLCYPAGMQGDSPSIPDGVTSIGVHAFAFCGRLTAICYGGSEAE